MSACVFVLGCHWVLFPDPLSHTEVIQRTQVLNRTSFREQFSSYEDAHLPTGL